MAKTLVDKRGEEKPMGRFGQAVTEALERKGMTVTDLAKALDATYEHTRKLVKGMSFPSKLMLKQVCHSLGLKYPEMEELVAYDRMRHKFGKFAVTVTGGDPRLEPLTNVARSLSEHGLEQLTVMARTIHRQENADQKR